MNELGKIPPQAIDLEEAVLGAVLLESDCLIQIMDFVTVETFYKSQHQLIWSAIQLLFSRSEPIDILTVTDQLRKTGELEKVGGAYFIATLTNRVASSLSVETHARIIQEKYIQRQLISVGSQISTDAYNDQIDVFDLMEQAESMIFKTSEQITRKDFENISSLIIDEMRDLQTRMKSEAKLLGIPSGYTDLDRITNGWQGPNLVIIAARPSMGKTALALNIARNAAVDFNVPIAFFSLEMSAKQLTQRLISIESEVDYSRIQSGNVENEYELIYRKAGDISNSKIFIDDTSAIGIFELRSKARKMKMKHGIGLVIVDYLQLMRGEKEKNGNREQEISSVSRGLKALAKDLNIPVIALAQLSRSCESRSDKRPILSDLRESGSIEQDADIVGFLYRGAYYKDEGCPPSLIELNIAKNRNGAITLEPVLLNFSANIQKFSDKINEVF